MDVLPKRGGGQRRAAVMPPRSFTRALIPLVVLAAPEVQGDALNPDVSVTLDGYYKQEDTALSHRDKGFGLGHTELTLSAPIDDLFSGRLTTVYEEHEGESEVQVEEAYLQTNGLPASLSVRAGRFLSQVGYLNGRHLHEDDFVERPAAYRALLGSHYYDDGVRLNALLPTPFFWQVGAEVFSGASLSEGDEELGVFTLNTRVGGDLSVSQSWQLGLSYLRNRNAGVVEEDHDEEEEEHEHSHAASYTGRNLYIADAVWKWAPNGNARGAAADPEWRVPLRRRPEPVCHFGRHPRGLVPVRGIPLRAAVVCRPSLR